MHPLSQVQPKVLMPIAGERLVDRALGQVGVVVSFEAIAVNLHHGGAAVDASIPAVVHRSWETPDALGSAGAVGHLRPWLDGRDLLVVNGDTWHEVDLAAIVAAWDRRRVQVVVNGPGPLGPRSGIVASLYPAAVAAVAPTEPWGLWEWSWRDGLAAGTVEWVASTGRWFDCGTVRQYLHANLAVAGVGAAGWVVGGRAAVGTGASLQGVVVWDGAEVAPGEHLTGAVRATDGVTVAVRPWP